MGTSPWCSAWRCWDQHGMRAKVHDAHSGLKKARGNCPGASKAGTLCKERWAGSQGGQSTGRGSALSCKSAVPWWLNKVSRNGFMNSLVIIKCKMASRSEVKPRSPVSPLVLSGPWHLRTNWNGVSSLCLLFFVLAFQSNLLIKAQFSYMSTVLEHCFIDFCFSLQERDVFSCAVAKK